MTQESISKLAAECRAFADAWAAPGFKPSTFLADWRAKYAAYQDAVAACPSCEPDDPGDPPPA